MKRKAQGILALTLASRAAIANDTFGLGNGSYGPLTVMFGQTLTINSYNTVVSGPLNGSGSVVVTGSGAALSGVSPLPP